MAHAHVIEEMLDASRQLSIEERLTLIEALVSEARQELAQTKEGQSRKRYSPEELSAAVDLILPHYLNDEELTAFSALDAEDFYEEG